MNLGEAIFLHGRVDEAMEHYRRAMEIAPSIPDAYSNLGQCLAGRGDLKQAMELFEKGLKISPDFADLHNNYATALVASNRLDEAISHYHEALRLKPDFAMAYYNIGLVLAKRGKYGEAIAQLRKALEFKANYPEAEINLALLLATSPQDSARNGEEALAVAQRADRLTGGNQPEVLNTLAAAYAETGRFPDAIATASKALDLAKKQKKKELTETLPGEIALYKAGKPYRQSPAKPAVKPQAAKVPTATAKP